MIYANSGNYKFFGLEIEQLTLVCLVAAIYNCELFLPYQRAIVCFVQNIRLTG